MRMKKITMLISVTLLTLALTFGANSIVNTEVTASNDDSSVQMMYDPTIGGWG